MRVFACTGKRETGNRRHAASCMIYRYREDSIPRAATSQVLNPRSIDYGCITYLPTCRLPTKPGPTFVPETMRAVSAFEEEATARCLFDEKLGNLCWTERLTLENDGSGVEFHGILILHSVALATGSRTITSDRTVCSNSSLSS